MANATVNQAALQAAIRAIQEAETIANNVEVRREGAKIILPEGMSYREARDWLERKETEESTPSRVHEIINAYPPDGAHALSLALSDIYGWVNMVPTPGFFGDSPPTMIGVQVSPTESIQVPWGRIEIPSIEGHLSTGLTVIEGRAVFVLGGVVRKRHMHEVSKIASLTREYAMKRSLYKGRAVRVSFPEDIENMDVMNDAPKFMEINGVKQDELVFSDSLREQIEVSVFTPIERTEACRAHGIPLKRGILLEGKYGTGKTLTAHVAAQLCEKHGWTFMYLADVRQLRQAISLAALYEPCVIFAEDIDRAVSGSRTTAMDDILNTIDGVDSKNREIMVILTTNHVEGINKAMLRPGRLDAVISVVPPDEEAVLKLIRLFSRGLLAGTDHDLKLAGVGAMLAGHIPATIREVVERAKLAAIRRPGELKLVAADLRLAAETMLHHLGLMKETPPDTRSDIVRAAGILADAMTQAASENGVGHIANK